MKVMPKQKNGFNPVTIEITFESAEEIEYFYSVFNHAAIADALAGLDVMPSKIRTALDNLAADFNYSRVFDEFAAKVANHPCIAIDTTDRRRQAKTKP